MKEIDYYAVLNIRRDASPEEIALAYRKLAVQHHPLRNQKQNASSSLATFINEINHLPALPSSTIWEYVNKAYDILSNPLRRQIYDIYGETGLQNGVPLPNGYFYPYVYHGDYMKTYNEVFGNNSPYADIIDAITNPPPLFSISTSETSKTVGLKTQDKPIEKLLYLDLKEIFTGILKRMKILRHEFLDNDKTKTEIREKILIVPIKPGTLSGTKIIFKQQGDRGISRIPADIIFITADKPHDVFTRKDADLYMNYVIDLKQALCGCTLKITTIDERQLSITLLDVIYPNYVKEIKGEGLPKLGDINQKGNLYIKFEVKFPMQIPRNLKPKIIQIFNELKSTEIKEEVQNQN